MKIANTNFYTLVCVKTCAIFSISAPSLINISTNKESSIKGTGVGAEGGGVRWGWRWGGGQKPTAFT